MYLPSLRVFHRERKFTWFKVSIFFWICFIIESLKIMHFLAMADMCGLTCTGTLFGYAAFNGMHFCSDVLLGEIMGAGAFCKRFQANNPSWRSLWHLIQICCPFEMLSKRNVMVSELSIYQERRKGGKQDKSQASSRPLPPSDSSYVCQIRVKLKMISQYGSVVSMNSQVSGAFRSAHARFSSSIASVNWSSGPPTSRYTTFHSTLIYDLHLCARRRIH